MTRSLPDPLTPGEIQDIRASLDLTQAELAQRCGSDIRTVQRWLAGDRRPRGAALVVLRSLQADGAK